MTERNNYQKIIDLLTKIFDFFRHRAWLGYATLIVSTGLLVVEGITLYRSCKSDEKEIVTKVPANVLLKDSIMSKISIIESTFLPEKIPQHLDSVKERNIILIKDFKVKSIEVATLLREYLIEPNLSDFSHLEAQELYDLDITLTTKREALWYSLVAAINNTLKLDSIGTEHDITGYIINKAILEKLILLDEQVEEKRQDYNNKRDNLFELMARKSPTKGDMKIGTKDDLLKMLKLYEDFVNDPLLLNYIDKTLSFLILQNKNYNVPLTKYLAGYDNV